jgi:hypothetical protein
MNSAAAAPSRFVRRTTLGEDEYRVNFKQIDCEVLDALASDEACEVTPSMCRIYIRLIRSPLPYWEREGVLHFVGEERGEESLTAWALMRELTGVSNSTLSKALAWMHEAGIIGYDARKNGVGIRIFINRAAASIRRREGQKNLRLVPAPSVMPPAPSDGMPFKEKFCRKDLDKDINPRTHSRAAGTLIGDESPAATSREQPPSKPTDYDITPGPSTQFSLGQVVGLVKRELEPVIASVCDEAIASACRKEAALNREWFERAGLPKAIRVAQHEAFNVLRSHGVIAKKALNSGDVGRHCATTEEGREGKNEKSRIATFLAEASISIRQVAANDTALENATLQNACLVADGELGRLHDRLVSGERFDLQELETKLGDVEDKLTKALWEMIPAADLEAMLKSARAELRGYEVRMEKEVFERTVRRGGETRLRERFGLPRLSLFYL